MKRVLFFVVFFFTMLVVVNQKSLPVYAAIDPSPSPSPIPSPVTSTGPEPTPFEFETIPGNTAQWTGIGGEGSFFEGGIFSNILRRVELFSVVFGRMIDGKFKIDVPNFERWGKWMEASVFPDSDNTGGPLIPNKLKIRTPQKADGNRLQIQQVNQPCSSESEVAQDEQGKPLGQKKGAPTDVLVSQVYDDYAYNYITGCSILMGLFGSQKQNGRTVSMPSLQINTKEQAVYEETSPGKFELKKDLYDPVTGDSKIGLYPCQSQSKGRKVNKTLWEVLNGGPHADTGSLAFQKTADSLSNFFDGAGNCIKDLPECIAAAKQALGLGLETTIMGPGLVGLNACWMGIRNQDIPDDILQDDPARKNLNSYLGVERTFISNKSASYQPIDYDDRHGTVKGQGLEVADAPVPSETPIPYAGFSGTVNASAYTQCAILPNRLQPTMFPPNGSQVDPTICNPVKDPGSMYSSDANLGTFPSDYNNGIPPVSGDFGTALKNAASTVGIPACVLQGVAFLEGGGRYPEKPLDQCLREVNYCSAAGPMQFTTGTGPASDPECTKCPVKYCPNAWASWGAGGNPCNYQDALAAAARKLKNDGPLTNADPKSQLSQILYAGYRYYGSKLPLEQTGRTGLGDLGKCSYGQVLYKTCDPSYQCSGKGG